MSAHPGTKSCWSTWKTKSCHRALEKKIMPLSSSISLDNNWQQTPEITSFFSPRTGQLKLGLSPPLALLFPSFLTNSSSPQSTRGCGHLTGRGYQCQRRQGGKGYLRDTSNLAFATNCRIGIFLPADSSCIGTAFLHFTQSGLSMSMTVGVVVEKDSEYISAPTGPGLRALDGRPRGGAWVGVIFLLLHSGIIRSGSGPTLIVS